MIEPKTLEDAVNTANVLLSLPKESWIAIGAAIVLGVPIVYALSKGADKSLDEKYGLQNKNFEKTWKPRSEERRRLQAPISQSQNKRRYNEKWYGYDRRTNGFTFAYSRF